MFGNAKPPRRPVIRRIVPAQSFSTPTPLNGTLTGTRGSSNGSRNDKKGVIIASSEVHRNGAFTRGHGKKRKAPSPSTLQPFDDSSASGNENDDRSEISLSRKQLKTESRGGFRGRDVKRRIFRVGIGKNEDDRIHIVQGRDLTEGKEKEFRNAFLTESGTREVDLMYPGRCQTERFQLVTPTEMDGYDPIEDVIQTVDHICQTYFPKPRSLVLVNENSGFARRLRRACVSQSFSNFAAVIAEFNKLIETSFVNNTFSSHLPALHSIPLPLVERILSQVYSRTVSPEVNILKQYENGGDNVYGELLPRFSHQIFNDTDLRSDQVFVDLGSGVGNVVLQAALQTGCECWGIEQMPNPCRLAEQQKKEFEKRCKYYGINSGSINLIQGDFLKDTAIDSALKRADVVLVNNQAFTPSLNDQLLMKFLDLKDGCQVVSLKSFVPAKWEIKSRNLHDPRNLLHPVTIKDYWSKYVSWTDQGGTYAIATKDSRRLMRFEGKPVLNAEDFDSMA